MRLRISLCLILILSGSLLPLAVASGQGQERATVEAQERLAIFDRVWTEVNDRYFDRSFHGVDWEAQREHFRPLASKTTNRDQLYQVMRQMLAGLGDAHTRVFSPEENFDRNHPSGISVGVIARRVEGRPVVVWVEPGSDAARQGLRAGMTIKSVDRVPIEAALKKVQSDYGTSSTPVAGELLSFDRLFFGPRDSTLQVTVEQDSGKDLSLSLTRRFVDFPRRVITRMLPNDIGYIELTGFSTDIERDFDNAINTLRNTRGLILDLRQNGGGFVASVTRLAGYFFPREADLGVFTTRKGKATRRQSQKMRISYKEPLVILLSERSASGAEMFAAAMQEHERAFLLGTHPTTCGCLVGVSRTLTLPDHGRLNISDADFRTALGQRIEGIGVHPDEVVQLRIADLINGKDRALEWAVAFLERRETIQ